MTNTTGAQVVTMWELYGCGMEQIAARVAQELNIPLHGQAFSSEQVEESMARREKGAPSDGSCGTSRRHHCPPAVRAMP